MTYEEMCHWVAEKEGLQWDDLISNNKSRDGIYKTTRHICYYLSELFYNISSSQAGSVFGQDHATVLHARRVIINDCETDRYFREKIDKYITGFIELRSYEGRDLVEAITHDDNAVKILLRSIDKIAVIAEAYCRITGKKII